ncbi:MAG: ABC transporter permease [Alphaproteobacteria bacterium]|nr:MAG: ABC transporter permease [Alphaproteobacteria bacterium]
MTGLRRTLLRELAFLRANGWDLALVTWIPLLLLAMMAWLFAAGVPRDLPVAVVDADHGAVARQYVQLLEATPGVRVGARPTTPAEGFALIRSGAVWAVVVVPAGTSRAIDRGGVGTLLAYPNAAYNTQSGAVMRDIGTAGARLGLSLAIGTEARLKDSAATMAPPLGVEARTLFNPQTSYELLLVPLVQTALLHLMMCLAAASAVGRELRDGTATAWLAAADDDIFAAVTGKLLPYFAVYTLFGVASLAVFSANGWPIAGSAWLLIAAQALLYLAYAGIGVLFVGLTGRMMRSLSLIGVYAGASLAFSGALFPTDGAPLFTRIFSAMTPYHWFARAQAQQLESGAPMAATVPLLAVILAFALAAFALALPLLGGLARDPARWGLR